MAKGAGTTRTSKSSAPKGIAPSGGGSITTSDVFEYLYKTENYVFADNNSMRVERVVSMKEDTSLSNSNFKVIDVVADYRSSEYPNEPEYLDFKLRINRKTKKIERY